MALKKIVFVIVEGPTDDEALGVMLERIFSSYTTHVEIMHCDITTEQPGRNSKLASNIAKTVRTFASQNHYTLRDFDRIIHLVDTDGAFVPDELVDEDPEIKKVKYYPGKICAKNRNAIIERNHRKSSNLRDLIRYDSIVGSIPYDVFYMSCNLDHVLYDIQNSSNDDKTKNALKFAKRYRNDVEGFVKYISESDFSVTGDYYESWRFIEDGVNSLGRHTNLALSFGPSLPGQKSNK
jgi:hypothetical protein